MGITASGPIRAKYFIKSKTIHHDHGPLYMTGPVVAHEDDGTENEGYFAASPTGECKLRYKSDTDPGLEVGAFYYFTFTPIEEKPEGHHWELYERSETEYGVTYTLRPSGSENPYSWHTEFVVEVDTNHTAADFGKPGGTFNLRVEKADV